ncbi:hypothetical protein ULMS_03560 [Patiriisocius marinistellae]|uniref:O-antigen ligase-related domain-containing protein n=2 Tax=Patiriisocius marinistellae TaxID=2494560 RepID=A0A5J4FUL5_9FLAO|nr:hypothetical protein ULMS_03560 [Patiriisocius marinistellae]
MLLFFIIPFDDYIRALPNILIIILIVTFPFVIKKEHIGKLRKLPTMLFIVFFGYIVLAALVTGRIETDFKIIKKIGIAAGLLVLYLPVYHDRKVQKAIMFSALAAVIFSVVSIFYAANTNASFEFGDTQMVIEALLIDRLYLGLISVLSIVFSYYAMRREYHDHNKYYFANIVINVLFIALIVSKIAAIVCLVIFIVAQLYSKKKVLRAIMAITAIAIIFCAVFFIKNQLKSNTSKGFKTEVNTFFNTSNTWRTRIVAWDCAIKNIENQGINLAGVGFKKTKDDLINCYGTNIKNDTERATFVNERYNSHNQFLDIYSSTGLIGLLLFVGFLIVTFATNKKQFFPTAIIVTLVIYCLVENIFHRQMGAYYFGLMLIILLVSNNNPQNNTLKN